MTRKKVDDRIRTLINNCVKQKHRSLFVIVGDNGKDQVPNLHYILSKSQVKARPSVLWCYKNELGFSTHKKKRMRQIKKMVQRGLYDPEKDDPFELFVASTDIRWAYYKDSQKVLGQTFGMLVLQDFESMTPNLLARTVETVEGGGIVVLLLRTMDSLKQLYNMTMDVHARFRTQAYSNVQPRFNERFILSLSSCESCAVIDDELNILPLSKHIRKIEPVEDGSDSEDDNGRNKDGAELKELKQSLEGTQPAGALVSLAKTKDQAKAILSFIEAVSEKTLRSTVTLTAARGRGKSAALGVAIASAVAYGYSNIFVTSPAPENLGTVFEFVFKALDALKYKEHMDYEIIQSTNPAFNKAVVRVNLFHDHRQTIQYIQPQDYEMLAQAELVVIDEAAAIPLPLVRKLMGPYLVFLASTVNGYEGTGRSLSLKLIDQLRKRTAEQQTTKASDWRTNEFMFKKGNANNPWADDKKDDKGAMMSHAGSGGVGAAGRVLREIELEEPIRYASGDAVEDWLYRVLCLNASKLNYRLVSGTPHPNDCDLFAVDRDALFSHHKVSEAFLQRVMSLYVTSHYKNSPNDLQLLSDAPAHRLFVLLGRKESQKAGEAGQLPDVLCVVQVALEGGIAKEIVKRELSQGNRAAGDMVPWMVSQQFQDAEFGKLSGARIVRISTHPDVTRMGYGKRAVELLTQFYQGNLTSLSEEDQVADSFESLNRAHDAAASGKGLGKEKIKPRKDSPPLLVPLEELPSPNLHYLSVSYGVTEQLFNFWHKVGMRPFYLRQTANDLTGEHSCLMIRPLDCTNVPDSPEEGWVDGFCFDFVRRFLSLLGGPFRTLTSTLALNIANAAVATGTGSEQVEMPIKPVDAAQLNLFFLPHDMKRLEAYSRNLVDYHLVADLLPRLANMYLEGRMPSSVTLTQLQRALLIGMGLQCKTVDGLAAEFGLPSNQLLALFNKAIRKFSTNLRQILEAQVEDEMNSTGAMKDAKRIKKQLKNGSTMNPLSNSLEDEQTMDGDAAMADLANKQRALLGDLDLKEYAIDGESEEWKSAIAKAKESGTTLLSVKNTKKRKKKVEGEDMLADVVESETSNSAKKKKSKKGGRNHTTPSKSFKDSQKSKFSGRRSGGRHSRK